LLLFFGNGDEEKEFALHLFPLKIKKSNHSPGILSRKTKKNSTAWTAIEFKFHHCI
jgi:hypothetical protein